MSSWKKIGLVYKCSRDKSWRDNSGLTPTPLLLNNGVMRVFAGFRDTEGVSRIGYVDYDQNNRVIPIGQSEKPVLDIGKDGAFDDNGIILGDVILEKDHIRMYYVGFQIISKAKFLAFSGLAISNDYGISFQRIQETPILDRSKLGKSIGAIHTVLKVNNKYFIWFAVDDGWQVINNLKFPKYSIWIVESDDGLIIDLNKAKQCIVPNTEFGEYRIGRPRVRLLKNGKFEMMFTYGTLDGKYESGIAFSNDGYTWLRDDAQFPLNKSSEGWDSKHLSYPYHIDDPINNQELIYYNGNNMGFDGFGLSIKKNA